MSVMVSQITGNSTICLAACWTQHQRENQNALLVVLCEGNPLVNSGFPSQRTSNVERFSMSSWHYGSKNLLRTCYYNLCQERWLNSLAPGRSWCDSRNTIYNLISLIDICRSSYDYVFRWMLQHLTDDKSTLVQVIAWCRQATSHYLGQYRPRSLSPYGISRPQWVNMSVLVLSISMFLSFAKARLFLPLQCLWSVMIIWQQGPPLLTKPGIDMPGSCLLSSQKWQCFIFVISFNSISQRICLQLC